MIIAFKSENACLKMQRHATRVVTDDFFSTTSLCSPE